MKERKNTVKRRKSRKEKMTGKKGIDKSEDN